MGTDIHIYFEKYHEIETDSGNVKIWTPYPTRPKLDRKYWYEGLTMGKSKVIKIESEKAMLLFGCNDEEEALTKLEQFYINMPMAEAEILFVDNPNVIRDWGIPYTVRRRNYQFFSELNGVRAYGDTANFPIVNDNCGLPVDTCREIKNEFVHDEGDAHTPGWIMLDELFLKLPNFDNVANIKEYMEDLGEYEYEKIRMVFWYDN